MTYRRLGASGLKVSEICLGTMTFGRSTDEKEGARIVDLALDSGVNFIDTANNYNAGRSELILGKALEGKRRGAVVATKFFNATGPGPNDSGMSRVYIMNAVEDSLKRLRTDHIDIYYIHHVDVETPVEEMLRAVDDLVHQGKVRYIGCSNWQAWRLCDALWASRSLGMAGFVCYQAQYSLVVRDIEQEPIPLCLDKGIGVVPWGPLASGFLTGKYEPGQRSVPGTRSAEKWIFQDRYFAANADETLKTLLDEADRLGRPPAQVALRWVLQRPGVSSVIVGARNAGQMEQNLGAAELDLDSGTLEKLDAVSRLPDRYPESMERSMPERRAQALGKTPE